MAPYTLLVDVLPREAVARSNAAQHWYELANGSRICLFGLDPDPITGVPSKVGTVELGCRPWTRRLRAPSP
ncbi:MAG: hypothetical protein ABSE58_09675 [Candidatus Limnocylindrales bacterium]